MVGRYYLTGVQVGILMGGSEEARIKILQQITDHQFMGNDGDEYFEIGGKKWFKEEDLKDEINSK